MSKLGAALGHPGRELEDFVVKRERQVLMGVLGLAALLSATTAWVGNEQGSSEVVVGQEFGAAQGIPSQGDDNSRTSTSVDPSSTEGSGLPDLDFSNGLEPAVAEWARLIATSGGPVTEVSDWNITVRIDVPLKQQMLADPLSQLPKELLTIGDQVVGIEISYMVGDLPATTSLDLSLLPKGSDASLVIADAVAGYNEQNEERNGSKRSEASFYRVSAIVLPIRAISSLLNSDALVEEYAIDGSIGLGLDNSPRPSITQKVQDSPAPVGDDSDVPNTTVPSGD